MPTRRTSSRPVVRRPRLFEARHIKALGEVLVQLPLTEEGDGRPVVDYDDIVALLGGYLQSQNSNFRMAHWLQATERRPAVEQAAAAANPIGTAEESHSQ
mgnify:CR=1 FL=1